MILWKSKDGLSALAIAAAMPAPAATADGE
jgi:hypothetical protein